MRPEVRNSGVRTLFAVVVNQGPRLSRALWEQCLWEMLFPLLNHAYLMSATASRDEVRQGCVPVGCWHHSSANELPFWLIICCSMRSYCWPLDSACTSSSSSIAWHTSAPPRRSRWCWGSRAARRFA